jgi:hypothetical protein
MTTPATWDNLLQGTRIRCIFGGERFSQLGTIMKADRYCIDRGIIVSWDDDNPVVCWSYPGSFEVIEEQK